MLVIKHMQMLGITCMFTQKRTHLRSKFCQWSWLSLGPNDEILYKERTNRMNLHCCSDHPSKSCLHSTHLHQADSWLIITTPEWRWMLFCKTEKTRISPSLIQTLPQCTGILARDIVLSLHECTLYGETIHRIPQKTIHSPCSLTSVTTEFDN